MAKFIFCSIMCCVLIFHKCTGQALFCGVPPYEFPKADTANAIKSKHRDYTGTKVIVQLGYIDNDSATVQQIFDNLPLGLVALPNNDYEVVMFTVWKFHRLSDGVGTNTIIGNKFSLSDENVKTVFSRLTSGDQIAFDNIRIRRKGSDHTLPLNNGVVIKVIE